MHVLQVVQNGFEVRDVTVCVVGDAAVGKTRMIRAVVEPERGEETNAEHSTTRGTVGVVQTMWAPASAQLEVTLNILDFAGSHVYGAVNAALMPRRALFVLVWRPHHHVDETCRSVRTWLAFLAARAPGCSVLMVCTHTHAIHDCSSDVALVQQQCAAVRSVALEYATIALIGDANSVRVGLDDTSGSTGGTQWQDLRRTLVKAAKVR
jgi:hypothetical protein